MKKWKLIYTAWTTGIDQSLHECYNQSISDIIQGADAKSAEIGVSALLTLDLIQVMLA